MKKRRKLTTAVAHPVQCKQSSTWIGDPVNTIKVVVLFYFAVAFIVFSQAALAQSELILVPATSMERPQDVGMRAHTNHIIRVQAASPSSSSFAETPQSIRSVYKLPSTGGGGTIAIVDAYHYPTAQNDLNVFSKRFGLPACTTANGCFKRVYSAGTRPAADCGWAQEAALDIEWAHAMAPNAKIVLIEAASNYFSDLFVAVDLATSLVTTGGHRGEVSMSWSGTEFSNETKFDPHFQNTGVVYFAASGDTGGVNGYPSVSPAVVSAGGTTIHRSSAGGFLGETGWSESGGGPSRYELKPVYQMNVGGTSTTKRSAPDLSFDADPNSGVMVYDSTSCQGFSGWMVFGGTSVSTPSLAGIINLAAHFHMSSGTELATIYANRKNSNDFRDIISGKAGPYTAKLGYDFVTGVGSVKGLSGK
jgi:kumamolisin